MDLPIPDSNLQPSSRKSNALPTELLGLPLKVYVIHSMHIYSYIQYSNTYNAISDLEEHLTNMEEDLRQLEEEKVKVSNTPNHGPEYDR